MPSPPAQPSAWDHHCEVCGAFVSTRPHPDERQERHENCPTGLRPYPAPRGRWYWPRTKASARWGHEWAAVATMRAHEQAAERVWEYLNDARDELDGGELLVWVDSLPEDVMQLLAIGLDAECPSR